MHPAPANRALAVVLILHSKHSPPFVAPPADRNQRLKQAKLDAASDIAAYREKKERKFASAELQVVRSHTHCHAAFCTHRGSE